MKPLAFNRRPGKPPSRRVDRARELHQLAEAERAGKVTVCPRQSAPDPATTVSVAEFDNLIAPGPTGESGAPTFGRGRWCGTRRREE